jgi:hypothetical protein
MNTETNNWYEKSGASPHEVEAVEASIPFRLPESYRNFILKSNGAEGFLGEEHYAVFWPIEDLKQFNEEYEVHKYAPEVFLFGSNGGGEGFGFDLRNGCMPIVEIPFIGMDIKYANVVASDFSSFLAKRCEFL